MYLSDDSANPKRWSFPPQTTIAPGQFRLVWLDAQPGQGTVSELHAGFRISSADGLLVLSRDLDGGVQVLDSLRYQGISADESYGRFPADAPERTQVFAYPTPAAQNSNTSRPVTLWINEWMAGNAGSLADPADGDFEDWFEIYNPDATRVELAGYTLTDTLAAPGKFVIPAGGGLPRSAYHMPVTVRMTSGSVRTSAGGPARKILPLVQTATRSA